MVEMIASLSRMKRYWIMGSASGGLCILFLFIRLGVFQNGIDQTTSRLSASVVSLAERETWMDVFQDDRKIGFSKTKVSKNEKGYRIDQELFININTMGLVQDIRMKTRGILNPDLSMDSFQFQMNSGRFAFAAKGAFSGGMLDISIQNAGKEEQSQIRMEKPPYLAAGLFDAVIAHGLKPGEERSFPLFDLTSFGEIPVTVKALGKENILNMGISKAATKVTLFYKGASQFAWISEDGEVLREEGLLGMRLEKTSREKALSGAAVGSGRDLTEVASVPADGSIKNPQTRNDLVVEISGILLEGMDLHGGRQSLSGNRLSIIKEDLSGPSKWSSLPEKPTDALIPFLKSTPFIQSDHETVRRLALEITAGEKHPYDGIRNIVSWMNRNIEKRPTLSVPDALSTLENKMGDCNEHAMLFAALARAAGIPATVEAGLVYLKGRFYYHAWNRAFIGEWITVDSLFNQIPADVTHIRLIAGTERSQLDLLAAIGRIGIKILNG